MSSLLQIRAAAPRLALCLLMLAPLSAMADDDAARDAAPGDWKYKLGGLVQLRADRLGESYTDFGDTTSSLYLRRAALELSGRWRKSWFYEIKAELTDNDQVRLKNARVTFAGLSYGSITVGRFDPEFGLERTGSSAGHTGIERSAIWDLAPAAGDGDQGAGLAFSGSGRWHHVAAAVYRREGVTSLSGRAVLQPRLGKGQVLHLGVSYDDERIGRSDGRIRSRLGMHGVGVADGGNRATLAGADEGAGFDADRAWALEFAYQQGPYSVQAEALQRRLSGTGLREPRTARGHYVQLAWTLTGERRRYDADQARFANPRPGDSRWGAWELFYRYDRLGVTGEIGIVRPMRTQSTAEVHALGVNWYPRRELKLGANLLVSDSHGIVNNVGDSRGHGLSLQAQYAF